MAPLLAACTVWAAETDDSGSLTRQEFITGFVSTHCVDCHGNETAEADINLSGPYDQNHLLMRRSVWKRAIEQVELGLMPPESSQPNDQQREEWIRAVRMSFENVDWSALHDPGRLSMARLTAVEYRNAIRDIFGVDLQAGMTLGKDPEGNTGFSNDRETLTFPLFAFDDFMREAEHAVDSFMSYSRPRWQQAIEFEDAWAAVSDKSTSLSEDATEVVLKDRNSPFQLNLNLPYPGMYEIKFWAKPFDGEPVSGMRVVINGRTIDRIVIEGSESRPYVVTANLPSGANIVSLGFDPDRAPIIQPQIEPRSVPNKLAQQAKGPDVPNFPMPDRLKGNLEAERAWNKMNRVIRGYIETERLAAFLLQKDRTDFEKHKLVDGTSASVLGGFVTTKVPFNLSAGKVAVYLELPQSRLEKQIREQIGYSHAEYVKVIRNYNESWERKYPDRVPKKVGKIALDRATVRSHALVPSDIDPAWAFVPNHVDEWQPTHDSASKLLTTLGKRAYGRDLRSQELSMLMALYRRTSEELESPREGLRDAMVGLLVSPSFLLRYSESPSNDEDRIDPHELSHRIARFLWLSIPDDQLRALAKQGLIREPTVLQSQVDRLIEDERFLQTVAIFVEQWLDLGTLESLEEGRNADVATIRAMRREPAMLLGHIIREDRSLLELIDARYTFVNETLAHHYDLDWERSDDAAIMGSHRMRRIDLPNRRRGGLLSMAGMLTATSTPQRTSPVTRGAWIVELILGEQLPAAPASVPELSTKNTARTLREELEVHREATECAVCHRRIDPFGFVLENYDQFGGWRDRERGKRINARTQLPDGIVVDGLEQFRRYVIDHRRDDFVENLVTRMLQFALGRSLTYRDEHTVRGITSRVAAADYRARVLISEVVASEPFQMQGKYQVDEHASK